MPTSVDIFNIYERVNFVLSRVEYEKSFISSGPVFLRRGSNVDGPELQCLLKVKEDLI